MSIIILTAVVEKTQKVSGKYIKIRVMVVYYLESDPRERLTNTSHDYCREKYAACANPGERYLCRRKNNELFYLFYTHTHTHLTGERRCVRCVT